MWFNKTVMQKPLSYLNWVGLSSVVLYRMFRLIYGLSLLLQHEYYTCFL